MENGRDGKVPVVDTLPFKGRARVGMGDTAKLE
jgi:hypothetical protein